MTKRKKNRRLAQRERAAMLASKIDCPLPGPDDRVKLLAGVPGWGGRRGLVLERSEAHGATQLKVRLDKSGPTLTVLASEVLREDMLGREAHAPDSGSLWDVGASCFAAPDARLS